jgi:hypothetical protein
MRAWRRSPIMRTGYRVQYVLKMLAALAIVAAIPAAALMGNGVYTHLSTVAAHSRSVSRVVDATLDADAESSGPYSASGSAQAQWTLSGITHRGTIKADAGAHAGDRVQLWVRPDGSPTTAPPTRVMITVAAIAAAASAFAVIAITLLIVLRIYRVLLDRSRQASWGREWKALAVNRRWNRL